MTQAADALAGLPAPAVAATDAARQAQALGRRPVWLVVRSLFLLTKPRIIELLQIGRAHV